MFEEDLVDFVATDTHDMSTRHPNMTEAYEKLCTWLGEEQAKKLTWKNQVNYFTKG